MPQKIILKLRSTSAPHLYIDKIKEMMEGDSYLHPMMKNTLLLLKKTRMPYVILATLKELIFVPEKNLHIERGLQPGDTGYFKIDWTEKEVQESKDNYEKFKDNILKKYNGLGYDIFAKEELSLIKIEEILKSLEKKK